MGKKGNLSKSKKKSDDSSPLPGRPGYRTRDGRSGYDPLDTRAEAGHMAGSFIRRLFAGQIRSRLQLFLVGLLGILLMAPLVLAISEAQSGNLFPWNAWLLLSVVAIAGLAILINFIRNLLRMVRG
jgi:hypothetical protein